MPWSVMTKEFILLTLDENSSLVAGKISNDNHIFVNPNDTRSRSPEICAKSNLENSIDSPRDFSRASECAQMNLKTKSGEATTSTLSDAKRTEDAATAVKSENVILDLLSCGLSGGEVERARQILRKISNSERVSMNNISGRSCLHDADTGLAVLDFLSDIQMPTKKIDDLSLDLVRRLRLPEYLLANTFAKKVAPEMKSGSNEDDESPFTSYPRPNNEHAKWLRLYWSQQPQLSKSSQEEGGSSSLSWLNDERHAQKKVHLWQLSKSSEKDRVNNPPSGATFAVGFLTKAVVW